MGAISSALWSAVVGGDEIVADETLYGCTYALLNHGMSKFGVKVTLTDLSDIENLKKNLTDKTKVVYFETPCNPTLKLLDIELIAKTAHAFNPDIRVIVDNTFCTPYLQQPLRWGADVVVHSATKYLNGHGDVIAGMVVGKEDFITQCGHESLRRLPDRPGPQDAGHPDGAPLCQRPEGSGVLREPSRSGKGLLSRSGLLPGS